MGRRTTSQAKAFSVYLNRILNLPIILHSLVAYITLVTNENYYIESKYVQKFPNTSDLNIQCENHLKKINYFVSRGTK